MVPFNFGPACRTESLVFGAAAPDPHDPEQLRDWLDCITADGIERVVCLLSRRETAAYAGIRGGLVREFDRSFDGPVLHVPIDGGLPGPARLIEVVDFLHRAVEDGAPTLVHCAYGMSRTAIALAAWLVAGRGYGPPDALDAVCAVPGVRRDPFEAERAGLVRSGTVAALLAALPPCGPSPRRVLLRAVS
jgi:hypothetical protein